MCLLCLLVFVSCFCFACMGFVGGLFMCFCVLLMLFSVVSCGFSVLACLFFCVLFMLFSGVSSVVSVMFVLFCVLFALWTMVNGKCFLITGTFIYSFYRRIQCFLF